MIHLATGLAVHEERVLLVASRYPNHVEPLWNLPGGRQQAGELLSETAVREFFEETGLHVDVEELAYVSESYDGEMHFLNVTFKVVACTSFDSACPERSAAALSRRAQDDKGSGGDHIVALEWVPIKKVAERIVVDVVREPLLAYLRQAQRYAGFHQAGITIEWPADSH